MKTEVEKLIDNLFENNSLDIKEVVKEKIAKQVFETVKEEYIKENGNV